MNVDLFVVLQQDREIEDCIYGAEFFAFVGICDIPVVDKLDKISLAGRWSYGLYSTFIS